MTAVQRVTNPRQLDAHTYGILQTVDTMEHGAWWTHISRDTDRDQSTTWTALCLDIVRHTDTHITVSAVLTCAARMTNRQSCADSDEPREAQLRAHSLHCTALPDPVAGARETLGLREAGAVEGALLNHKVGMRVNRWSWSRPLQLRWWRQQPLALGARLLRRSGRPGANARPGGSCCRWKQPRIELGRVGPVVGRRVAVRLVEPSVLRHTRDMQTIVSVQSEQAHGSSSRSVCTCSADRVFSSLASSEVRMAAEGLSAGDVLHALMIRSASGGGIPEGSGGLRFSSATAAATCSGS